MPDRSSADGALPARLLMILLGYLPLLHAGLVVFLALGGGPAPLGPRLLLAAAVLYLAPALVVNAASRRMPRPAGALRPGSREFLVWWFCLQCQMLFNRLPFLEELLRLVPALYSGWLRLWGARVGALVYWSPGVLVLDRQWIEVGDRAVIGAGARLAPHFLAKDEEGRPVLYAGPVKIGSGAIVGGYSILSAGVSVEPGFVTRSARPLRPFSRHPETVAAAGSAGE